MEITVVLLFVAAMLGLTYRAVTAFLIRGQLEVARRENQSLKAQRATLREDAFNLGARATERIERGRGLPTSAGRGRVLHAPGPDAPSRNAGNDSIIAWLSSKGEQLQALSAELSDAEATAGARQGPIAARHAVAAGSPTGVDARQAAVGGSSRSRSVGKAAE